MSSTWTELLESNDLELLHTARIGRLATLGSGGFPSVVPICFALLDEPDATIVSVLDEKPKSVSDAELGRVRNIVRHPYVGLTIDHYEEDWSKLFHIQLKGFARIATPDDPLHAPGLTTLRSKYPQYRVMDLSGRSMIVIDRIRVRIWRVAQESQD